MNPAFDAFQFREFKFFLIIRAALVFAWCMQFVVIEWEVYQLTKDPFSLGLIGLLEIIPAFSTAIFAGHIVDRSEKKRLLLLCTSLLFLHSMAYLYCMSGLIEAQTTKLTLIYFLVFLGGIIRAFISPTVFSLMANIIPKAHIQNATSWSSSAWQMSSVLGPAVGGFAIHLIGVYYTMMIVCIVVSISLISNLQLSKTSIQNSKKEPMIDSLQQGLKFVFRTKVILSALTLDMVAVLFGGAVALLPVFAADVLEVGSLGFGLLRAAPAVGAFIVMVSIAFFPIKKQAGKALLVSVFIFGLSIMIFGLSRSFALSLFALFLSGLADGVSMIIRQTILYVYTPDDMKGRVAAVTNMFVGSSNELGAFESGITAKWMGTIPAVVFGACMTMGTVGIAALKSVSLRNLSFDSEVEPS